MSESYVIGIDMGGTSVKIGLLNPRNRIIGKKILTTSAYPRKADLLDAMKEAVAELCRGHRLDKKRIAGVGIGIPGPVDADKGLVHFLPNVKGWKDVPLRSVLSRRLGLPVFVDNDANVMCLAECTIGAAKRSRNAVCVTLGTGVGGGIIIDGKLYRGTSNITGEIGHMPINEHGPRCNCGGAACLESYVGNARILAQARQTFGSEVTLEDLSRRAARGEAGAVKFWDAVGRRIATALVSVVNLLNPDCIVIGGGVANAGEVLLRAVRREVAARAMPVQARDVRILRAALKNDAGMIGAGILARRERNEDLH